MKTRLIASFVLVLAAVTVMLSGEAVIIAAITILNMLSVYELCKSYGFCKRDTWFVPLYIEVLVFLVEGMSLSVFRNMIDTRLFSIAGYLYLMLGFLLVLCFHKEGRVKEQALFSLVGLSAALVYFFSQAANLRTDLPHGKYLLWTVLVGACMTDTFGLFMGKLFGRHRLAPHISPNKTIEGAVSGTIGAVLSMLVFGVVIGRFQNNLTVHYGALACLGFLCALAAQLGDLSMSALKREAGMKDFSHIIPGHGGVLDRMDSIIFVAPVAYSFLSYICVLG